MCVREGLVGEAQHLEEQDVGFFRRYHLYMWTSATLWSTHEHLNQR